MTSIQSLVPEKSIKSSGRSIKNEGLVLFSEFLVVCPLYCGNIYVAEVSTLHTRVVDTWVQESQAQKENTLNRPGFKKDLLVLASHKRYSKIGVECVRQLVIESGLQPLGYPTIWKGGR